MSPGVKLFLSRFPLPGQFGYVLIRGQFRHRNTDVHRTVHQEAVPGVRADVRINSRFHRRGELQHMLLSRRQHRRRPQNRIMIGHPVFRLTINAQRERGGGHSLPLAGLCEDEVVRHVVAVDEF